MTIEEYDVKCNLLRAACQPLDPHVLLFEDGWEIRGYLSDTDEVPLVRVKAKSYTLAEKVYREAHRKLFTAGRFKHAT